MAEERVFETKIVDELKKNFIEYAVEVNSNRAIPHVNPGIKPVAGHILWAMWANGRKSSKPYTKSAKVAGEVMSYNPHGSSYSSMARMAADFIYHVPYLDGHGSFGSAIGGPTAASDRYTEIRLAEFIEDVLFYNTKLLHMGMNYLDEEPEPILQDWVALLPLLFITNTSGIGYTMSNVWSSGNLYEFREQLLNYIEHGKVDCSKIYPDFPTGGVIINKSEMKELYETGKGTIKLRGNVEVDDDTIKILSLPYQVYPEDFIESIKKYINNNQHTIKDVSNRCGIDGFLIEIDCEKGTAEYTLDQLYRKTTLQVNISDEHRAVGTDGKPMMVTFKDYMKIFVDSNIDLVIKEAKLNLDEINARLEIVNGLLSALDIIDEIIAAIKASKSQDDAKKVIMAKWEFTENQADAIVHTTLGRLANLEKIKLQEEKEELDKRKSVNEELLNSRNAQESYFLERFNKLIDKYAWERKTSLADITMAPDVTTKVSKPAQLKAKKEFMVVLTENNHLKKIDITRYKKTKEDEKSVKVKVGDKITLVTKQGNMYKIPIAKIDKCLPNAQGTRIPIDEEVLNIYNSDISLPYVIIITEKGIAKKCLVDKVLTISKSSGTPIIKFKKENDSILAIKLANDDTIIELETDKKVEQIAVKDMKLSSKGATGSMITKNKILNVKSL